MSSIELPQSKEILFVNIGQTGCQMGNNVWELFNVEHNINPDGFSKTTDNRGDFSVKSVYNEVGCDKYVPRCIFVDLEDSTINEIKKSSYRYLFHPDCLINGFMDSSNNYGRAYHNLGVKILGAIMEQIRKQVENCNGLQGIFLTHSLGGGTGSGLFALLTEALSRQYRKTYKFDLSVFPSPILSDTIVEPYNAILSSSLTINHVELGFIMDNEAVWDICTNKLDVQRPSYGSINRLVAQVVSGITSPLRYKGNLQGDMVEFQTNLVAFPRIHFPLITFSPIITAEKVPFDPLYTSDITMDVFRNDHSFVKCNMSDGKFMSACIMYRGDVDLNDARSAINLVRKRIKFANWCPTGVKLDLNSSRQANLGGGPDLAPFLPRSVTLAANHSSISSAWERIISQFEHLYRKRAFYHWFAMEGVEENEFELSRQEMDHMMRDYHEISFDY